MSNGCPNVILTPGAPGTAPATWGNPVTLATTDLVGFGTMSAGSKVSLKCSDTRTLVDALPVVSWSPQTIVVTLPAKNAVAACDSPLYYQLWVHIPAMLLLPAKDCGPYTIDITSVIDPTQPGSIDPNDLTELAHGFHISVTVPGPGMVPKAGVPVRAQLVPPLGTGLPFTGVDGLPLPLNTKWNPTIGAMRAQALGLVAEAASRRVEVPPLLVRSPATYAALAKEFAARQHAASPGLGKPGADILGRTALGLAGISLRHFPYQRLPSRLR